MKSQMTKIYGTIDEEEKYGDVLNDEVKRLPKSLWTTSKKNYPIGGRSTTLGDPHCGVGTGCANCLMNTEASGQVSS